MSKPACPRCKMKNATELPDNQFRCNHCGTFYDSMPEEGGDFSDRNPAARLERADREREKRSNNGR